MNLMLGKKSFPSVVSGRKGGGKGGGGGGGSESPNTLRSKATARILDLLCEGEIKGLVNGAKSIFLNETPLMAEDGSYNFDGVQWAMRLGLPDQPPIPGAKGIEAITSVGVEVKKGAPVTRALVDPDYDSCVVTMRFPAISSADDKGNINPASVSFRIDIRYQGGTWDTTTGNVTLSGKNISPYDKQYYFKLPKNPSGASAPWEIRVTRLSEDSESVKYQNTTIFASIQGNIEAKFTYPYSAYVGMTIDSEQFNQSIPSRGYECDLRIIEIPSNYTPRIYDAEGNITQQASYNGIWDGTFTESWCNNPAWVFRDMLVNDRFGLGDYLDTLAIDKWSLYEIAQYCDEIVPNGFGGTEPRMTYNGVITEQREAYDTLSTMASCFRGMAYWSSGSIMSVQDSPKDPVVLVNPANVINGNFERQTSAKKARHTAAVVKFNDPADFYKTGFEIYQNEDGVRKYGYRPSQLVATGCTSRGQAYRMGKWTVLTELFETGVITYQAGLDHAGVRPGDIVAVQDPSQSGVEFGGRLAGDPSEVLASRGLRSQDWALSTPASGTASIDNGIMTLKGGTGGVSSHASQTINTIPGKTYRISVRTLDPQALIIMVGTSLNGTQRLNQTTPTVAGVYSYSFTATTAQTYIRLRRTVTTAMTLTDVSVQLNANTLTSVEVDDPVVFEAGKTYWLSLQLPDGAVEERSITPAAYGVESKVITVAQPFSKVPDPQSMWIVSRNDLVPELFRVITVRESEPHIYDVMCLQYEPSKFDAVDEDAQFDPLDINDLPKGPLAKPTQFAYKEYPASLGESGTVIALDLSIAAPTDSRVAQFQWQYRAPVTDGSGGVTDWQNLAFDYNPTTTVQGLDKGTYDFRVRSISTLGGYSGWLTVDNVMLLGLSLPPPDVEDFRISVLGDRSSLSWSISSMLNVSHFEIRHTPLQDNPVWASSIIVVEKASGAGVQLPTLRGTYSIKAVSFGGAYSKNAMFVVNDIVGGADLNVIEYMIQQPTFPGTRTNVTVSGPDLILQEDANGDFPPLGMYNFAQILDLGNVYTSRVGATIQVFGIDTRDSMASWESLASVESLANAASDLWDLKLEYSTTNDDPAGTPVWTDWQELVTGDLKFRAIRVRLQLISSNPAVTPGVRRLELSVDMPDRIIADNDLVVPTAGMTVQFIPPFKALSGLAFADQNMQTGDYKIVTNKSAAGFTIRYYNAAGTPISRMFDYNAVGYGEVQ